jgi:nucleotide-binding universal stress UspA family protein
MAIAKRAGAALHLLHVQSSMESEIGEISPYSEDIVAALMQRHEVYLENLAQQCRQRGVNDVATTVKVGAVAEIIHDVAASLTADLIVMTTHGRGPFARFWLGSVADSLLREATQPMLLVKPATAESKTALPASPEQVSLKRLLLPLDGTNLAEQIIEPAIALGSLFGAEYSLLRVIQPLLPTVPSVEFAANAALLQEQVRGLHEQAKTAAAKYLEEVAGRLRGRALTVSSEVADADSPAEAILQRATPPVDAVGIATHGRHGLPRMFIGSVADKVVRGCHWPVLIYRPK